MSSADAADPDVPPPPWETDIGRAIADYKPGSNLALSELKNLSLPSRQVLFGLDVRIFQLLETRAVWGLKNLLVPIIWLNLARRRRTEFIRERKVMQVTNQQIVGVLQGSAVFKLWPAPLLAELATHAKPWCFSRGELIFYEREPSYAIVAFLKGTATVATSGSSEKGMKELTAKSSCNFKVLSVVGPRMLFGEYAILAEELKVWVKADEHCDVLFIKGDDFVSFLDKLPPHVRQDVADASLEKRKRNMAERGMCSNDLQGSFMLKCIPSTFADEVVRHFQVEVVPRGVILCHQGKPGSRLFFLSNGSAEVSVTGGDGNQVVVAVLQSGAFFGELSLWYQQPSSASVKSASVCELWTLGVSTIPMIKALLQRSGDSVEIDLQTRHRRRSNQLLMKDSLQKKFKECVKASLPIYNVLLTDEEIAELVAMFEPEVYIINDMMLSRSQNCDRLLLITEGCAVHLQERGVDRKLQSGTFVGYTCLALHKWRTTVVATGNADAWSIPQRALWQYLHRIGKYASALRLTRLLLQPHITEAHLPSWDKGLPRGTMAALSCIEGGIRDLKEASTNHHPVDFATEIIVFPKYVPQKKAQGKGDGRQGDRNLPSSFSVITTEQRKDLPKSLIGMYDTDKRAPQKMKPMGCFRIAIEKTHQANTSFGPRLACSNSAPWGPEGCFASMTPKSPPSKPSGKKKRLPATPVAQLVMEVELAEAEWLGRHGVHCGKNSPPQGAGLVPRPPVSSDLMRVRSQACSGGGGGGVAKLRLPPKPVLSGVLPFESVGSLLQRYYHPHKQRGWRKRPVSGRMLNPTPHSWESSPFSAFPLSGREGGCASASTPPLQVTRSFEEEDLSLLPEVPCPCPDVAPPSGCGEVFEL